MNTNTKAKETAVAREEDRSATYAALIDKIEQLLTVMERHSLAELIELFRRPRRMLFLSFTSGIARGFGMAVGFTIIGALFLYFLGRIAALNLPVIGEFVAEIARIVQFELGGP